MSFCQHCILCCGQLPSQNDMFFRMYGDFRHLNLYPVCAGPGEHNWFPLTQPFGGLPSLWVWAGVEPQASPSQRFLCCWQRANASFGKGRAYSSSASTLILKRLSNNEAVTKPWEHFSGADRLSLISFFKKEGAPRKGVKVSLKP